MSWQALQFALDCDKCESVAEKIVLVEYANHADDRGYSWPSLKFIASVWRTHPARLRRARGSIIAKKLLFRTKKRRGSTHQNKVFRMPKCTYERGAQSPPFEKQQRGHKGGDKRAIRGSQSPTNLDPDNLKPISTDNTLRVASTTGVQPNGEVSKSLDEVYQYQKQLRSARDHVKWPEFSEWCHSKRGAPTEEGFWKWLGGQKPQWRNRRKERFEEKGYVLDGKFLTEAQANQLGRENPDYLTRFRKAVKRNKGIFIT